jgi:hypothetical protein
VKLKRNWRSAVSSPPATPRSFKSHKMAEPDRKWPLHRDHFPTYCGVPISSIPPVVPTPVSWLVGCLFNCSSSDYVPLNDRMNHELEKRFKEVVVAYLKVLSRNLVEGLRNFTKSPCQASRSPAPHLNRNRPNAMQNCSPFGRDVRFNFYRNIVVHVDVVGLRLWTAATKGPIVHPQLIYEYEEPRWNYIDRKTEELGQTPVPVPLCPPQIPHGLTRALVSYYIFDYINVESELYCL